LKGKLCRRWKSAAASSGVLRSLIRAASIAAAVAFAASSWIIRATCAASKVAAGSTTGVAAGVAAGVVVVESEVVVPTSGVYTVGDAGGVFPRSTALAVFLAVLAVLRASLTS
jgi:hypothetical protein